MPRRALNRVLPALALPVVLAPLAAAQATVPPAQSPAQADAGDGNLPDVRSREDFLALDRQDRRAFSRAKRPPVSFFVEGAGDYTSPADVEDATGDIAVWRLHGGAGLSFRVSDTADFIVRGAAEFSFYDFEDTAGLIPSAPTVEDIVEDVYDLTLSPILRVQPDDGWQWFIGGRVRSSGEPGADFGDTITGGGLVGASYGISDTLRLGAAVNFNARFEGGLFVLPIPIIEWDITDDISLRTIERGITLEYWFTQSWNLGLQVGFDRREYRLADDNEALPGGAFTDRRIPLLLALTYAPSPRTIVSLRAGAKVWGEIEFHNANDDQVAEHDLGSAFFAGLDVRLVF